MVMMEAMKETIWLQELLDDLGIDQYLLKINCDSIVGCLKITKDKSSKSRVQTPDAGIIIASLQHQDAKVETRVSVSLQHRDAKDETRVSASLQHQDARVKTRVSVLLQQQGTRLKTRVSVITAFVIGSITAHVMRELTPIMERF